MLKLIIDLGNTQSKWALFDGQCMLDLVVHQGFDPVILLNFVKSNPGIKAIILSSVIEYDENLANELSSLSETIVLNHQTLLPILNLYKTPQTLGKDRLAAAVGANMLFPDKNVLVIDAGTCIKYDFVNAHNEYMGGSISPGLKMRFNALHTFTDKLPLIQLVEKPAYLTGTTTEEAILTGVLHGCLAEIDGMIENYRSIYKNLTVVLTGGDSIYFDKTLKNSIFASPNIVLEGLNAILDYNVKKQL